MHWDSSPRGGGNHVVNGRAATPGSSPRADARSITAPTDTWCRTASGGNPTTGKAPSLPTQATAFPLPAGPRHSGLVDGLGRHIDYLRISVTDRCNFRCTYCIGEHPAFLPKTEVLTLDEIDRIATTFVALGVRRLRLTGGEPLVRRGIVGLVSSLARHLKSGDLDEITMTTNGALLAHFAESLAEAGLRRINVSLDTLDHKTFARVSRFGSLKDVLTGLEAAHRAGLTVRLNCVVQAGINDRNIDDLMMFAHERDMDLALIETMPIGRASGERPDRYVPLSLVRADLEKRWTLVDLPDRTFGPARYVRVRETGGRVGFITPISHGFCEGCNRVRLTCDGRLTLCLGRDGSIDLKPVLRASAGDEPIRAAIAAAVAQKPHRHGFDLSHADRGGVAHSMHGTGG